MSWEVCCQALDRAIQAVKPGVRYRDIGDVISQHVGAHKFQVVRSYCGHGICDLFHCAPNIPHYARNKVRSVCSVCCYCPAQQGLHCKALCCKVSINVCVTGSGGDEGGADLYD